MHTLSMKNLILVGIASIVAVASIPTSNANALYGCRTQSVSKTNQWKWTGHYVIHTLSPIPEFEYVDFVAAIIYRYCPNRIGDTGPVLGSPKVKPLKVSWCYTRESKEKAYFRGVRFNSYFESEKRKVNPPPKKIYKEGVYQKCGTQRIKKEKQKWLSMPDSPFWKAKATIIANYQPDRTYQAKVKVNGKNRTYKFFKPLEDRNVGPWR